MRYQRQPIMCTDTISTPVSSNNITVDARIALLIHVLKLGGHPFTDEKWYTHRQTLHVRIWVVHIVVIILFQRSNTREARSTARSKVHVREGQMMTTPQIHQPLSSFVSLAKRSSLGTRNSVPDPDRLGFSSIIQKGNTDTMSMNSMPVKTRVVVTDSMTVQFRTTAIAVENLQYARPSSALGPHSSIQIVYLDPSRLPLT